MCEIYSKLTIKTPERRHRRRSGVFIVNFEQISGIVLVFPLLTLTLSRRRLLSYRNQSIDLLRKSMDWFLYDNGLRLERVNTSNCCWYETSSKCKITLFEILLSPLHWRRQQNTILQYYDQAVVKISKTYIHIRYKHPLLLGTLIHLFSSYFPNP